MATVDESTHQSAQNENGFGQIESRTTNALGRFICSSLEFGSCLSLGFDEPFYIYSSESDLAAHADMRHDWLGASGVVP